MKMNGPVHCESFFQDQILLGRQELWCVSLAPNGEILSLFDLNVDGTSVTKRLNGFIKKESPAQIILVKTNPESLIFDYDDWLLIEETKKLCRLHPTELCDYIKLGPQGFCNLLEFEI